MGHMSELPSRYETYPVADWAPLRAATPLTLDETELDELLGINERLDLEEVAEVYLPLSRLLNLHVAATQQLSEVTATLIGALHQPVPYVIGIAGSVAVGKSTIARVLQALLAHWPNSPRVDLITTDGFLLPNAELEARNLMHRKGFPESYDQAALIAFLALVKSGAPSATTPVYSHTVYDIVDGATNVVSNPDVLIVEGLNVLQTGSTRRPDGTTPSPQVFVSDFFDFSIYVDAEEKHIESWYVERFLALRDTVFQDPESFFHRYGDLSTEEAIIEAQGIWRAINGPNLHNNIAPTKERADLILGKGVDHRVEQVKLRKR
jgi:type I pantothenate kinase